jgi:predicted CoA-binding protein
MEKNASCEFPDSNPLNEDIRNLLQKAKRIAIVGLSDRPERDSNRVAAYLKDRGYVIVPVNPGKSQILGEPCYPDLKSVPGKIDIVDIFRTVDAIPGIVDEAIAIGAGAVWMQLGLAHRASAEKARRAGLDVVQSKCIKVEHGKLAGQGG